MASIWALGQSRTTKLILRRRELFRDLSMAMLVHSRKVVATFEQDKRQLAQLAVFELLGQVGVCVCVCICAFVHLGIVVAICSFVHLCI